MTVDLILDPRDLAPAELVARAAAVGLGGEGLRRWVSEVVGRGRHDPAGWIRTGILPKRVATRLAPLPRLRLDALQTSAVDGFQKLRFRTADDLAVETVLIPLHKQGATSVCLSSQVGCAMACAFCATARMPSRRNLATWEIVDQFLQARDLARSQGRHVTGAVFMGMGEPFLPGVKSHVLRAAALLCCPFGAQVASKAITISTVGIVPSIHEYIDEGHKYRLSISLGAATDARRARLVPQAARWPVAELMAAARRYALDRATRVNLSYVCIDGENVSEDDARALGDLIGDTPVRLDLIEVTDPTGRYRPPSPERLGAFRDALTRYVGQPVVRRYSGGADIQAACGTLAGVQSYRMASIAPPS
ncbi:MAG TPA: radical SAM protein [Isosphaeraceae bacterium]|nr:radical SAM protein [Isosphaeraceae bacterium]